MRRFIIILAVIAALFGLAYFLKIQDMIPYLSSPRKNIKQYLPQGSQLGYPLRIPEGFRVDLFADLRGGLPEVFTFDSQGTLLVSIPNKRKVVALPDENNDGKADKTVDVLTGLKKPYGIAFDNDYLYVAEADKVVRHYYNPDDFSTSFPEVLFELPSGGRNPTKTIRIHGNKLYTSVGSSILVSELDGSNLKVFAKGLKNTAFFIFDSQGRIWGTDSGGELNLIEEGKDYGWPYCYGDKIRDSKFKPGEEELYCLETESPKFNFLTDSVLLGLVSIDSGLFSSSDQGNLLVAVDYKLVKLSVFAGHVSGSKDFISGFLQGQEILGRPTDLIFDENRNLYVSDNKTGLIYIITR